MISIISCVKCTLTHNLKNNSISILKSQASYFSVRSSLFVKKKFSSDHDSEVESDGEFLNKGDKLFRAKLKSLRIDAVLKAGLKMSRNKIEKAFYQDRIRVNGLRPKKKSQMIGEEEEVDIIREFNKINPKFLDVSRVEIKKVTDESDGSYEEDSDSDSDSETDKICVLLKKYKLLTVENYDEPWKGNDEE